MRAQSLLKQNVEALLRARHQQDKDLAMWVGHSGGWISKVFKGERNIRVTDLDRIADFFGLSVYQLFAPGIGPLTERRVVQRRKLKERRIADRSAILANIPQKRRRRRKVEEDDEEATG